MSLRRLALVSLLTLTSSLAAWAQALEEGPHVFWKGAKAQVLEVQEGKLVSKELGPDGRLKVAGVGTLALSPESPAAPGVRFDEGWRVVAVSDVHGQLDTFKTLLRAHGVMDKHLRWALGDGRLVIVGDVADRGPDVTRIYWLIRSLQQQAQKVGGGVHFLLGNHEVMLLQGDTRYCHPSLQGLAQYFGRDMSGLLGEDTDLGRWLRAQPVAIRIGDFVFMHGGLAPARYQAGLKLDAINDQAHAQLAKRDYSDWFGSEGLLWYRGLIPGAGKKGSEASTADIAQMMEKMKLRGFVVGHTTLEHVTAFHGGRVFGIDAGLKDGKPGEAWILEKGKVYRGLADGSRVPLESYALPMAAGQ